MSAGECTVRKFINATKAAVISAVLRDRKGTNRDTRSLLRSAAGAIGLLGFTSS
jgi:hypothetical protein